MVDYKVLLDFLINLHLNILLIEQNYHNLQLFYNFFLYVLILIYLLNLFQKIMDYIYNKLIHQNYLDFYMIHLILFFPIHLLKVLNLNHFHKNDYILILGHLYIIFYFLYKIIVKFFQYKYHIHV